MSGRRVVRRVLFEKVTGEQGVEGDERERSKALWIHLESVVVLTWEDVWDVPRTARRPEGWSTVSKENGREEIPGTSKGSGQGVLTGFEQGAL